MKPTLPAFLDRFVHWLRRPGEGQAWCVRHRHYYDLHLLKGCIDCLKEEGTFFRGRDADADAEAGVPTGSAGRTPPRDGE